MVTQDTFKLSVIVLTRNEEENIGKILKDVHRKVREPFEILVVDDSNDHTQDIVGEFSIAHRNVRLVPQEGEGYTNAIVTAVKHFDGDAMAVIVGDTSDDIQDIENMRNKLEEGYDVACASRYMKGGSRTGGSSFPW